MRRYFISAFSSVTALAASALRPVAAAESQNPPRKPECRHGRSPTQLLSIQRRRIELAGFSMPSPGVRSIALSFCRNWRLPYVLIFSQRERLW